MLFFYLFLHNCSCVRSELAAAVEMYLSSVNGSSGAFLAVHVGPGGCEVSKYHGLFFTVFPANSSFVVSSDISKSRFTVGFHHQLRNAAILLSFTCGFFLATKANVVLSK